MRLLIVEDHLLVVEMLIRALETEHTIAAAFVRGSDALVWLAHYTCDCAIVDLCLPDMDGVELIRMIRCHDRTIRIVATSGYTSHTDCDGIGADAFVPKAGSLALLRYEIGKGREGARLEDLRHRRLAPRKVAILRAVASGYRAREIASFLGVSQNTAEEYLEQLKRQLGARTLAQLITAALRLGYAADVLCGLPPPGGD